MSLNPIPELTSLSLTSASFSGASSGSCSATSSIACSSTNKKSIYPLEPSPELLSAIENSTNLITDLARIVLGYACEYISPTPQNALFAPSKLSPEDQQKLTFLLKAQLPTYIDLSKTSFDAERIPTTYTSIVSAANLYDCVSCGDAPFLKLAEKCTHLQSVLIGAAEDNHLGQICPITVSGLEQLLKMRSIRALSITGKHAISTLDTILPRYPHLEALSYTPPFIPTPFGRTPMIGGFMRCPFTKEHLRFLQQIPNLSTLRLDGITPGSLGQTLRNCKKLTTLVVEGVFLREDLEEIAACSHLQHLSLDIDMYSGRSAMITKDILLQFQKLPLKTLFINDIRSILIDAFCLLKELKTVQNFFIHANPGTNFLGYPLKLIAENLPPSLKLLRLSFIENRQKSYLEALCEAKAIIETVVCNIPSGGGHEQEIQDDLFNFITSDSFSPTITNVILVSPIKTTKPTRYLFGDVNARPRQSLTILSYEQWAESYPPILSLRSSACELFEKLHTYPNMLRE